MARPEFKLLHNARKALFLALTLMAIVLVQSRIAVSQTNAAKTRQIQDLGHGYKLFARSEDTSKTPNAFEAIAHFEDLYFRSRRIGRAIGQRFISPSGSYAIFEEDGRLILFEKKIGKTTNITDGNFAIPENVTWSEIKGEVHITYYEKHKPSVISLPKKKK